MSDSNKILLFSDYLFFTKLVDLPVSIKQKDIRFFVENELESSSPISLDILKWSYLKVKDSLLIFASTSDRLAQSGHTHEDMDSAMYAVPEAGLLAKFAFADGWNIIKMPKTLNAIYVEKGQWKNFYAIELGTGDFNSQCASFAKENAIAEYKLYSFDSFSQGSFSSVIVNLKGENTASLKSKFSANSVLSSLDLRNEEFLKGLRSEALKASAVLWLIKAVPLVLIALIAMQVSVYYKKQDLAILQEKAAILAPQAKKLQNISDQVTSARNFVKNQLFNALLIAKINNTRPYGVSFSKTSTNNNMEMVVSGEATNLSLLNDYISQLKNEDYISDIDFDSSSKSAGAKFKITIKFKELG